MNSIKSAVLIMLFASWTSSAMAGGGAASARSGEIHFSGTIVDGGCNISPDAKYQLKMSCFQNGRFTSKTTQLNIARPQKLPLNQGTTRFSWIDRSKSLALLNISYF
ncbi:hypothetical protein [Pantoea sp. B65]|uniref:hypothetical protein n=1 Tax=Pantoea sp. B65 TaxID=2813359 RepID=UPI0039B4DFEC